MSNEAAERLRRLQIAAIDGDEAFEANDLLDAALTTERKATVERIGNRITALTEAALSPPTLAELRTILDAEAQR